MACGPEGVTMNPTTTANTGLGSAVDAFLATQQLLSEDGSQPHGTHSGWAWVQEEAAKIDTPLARTVRWLPARPLPSGPAAEAWADEAVAVLRAAKDGLHVVRLGAASA